MSGSQFMTGTDHTRDRDDWLAAVMSDRRLPVRAYHLSWWIAYHVNRKRGVAFPSQETLSLLMKVSEETVRQTTVRLVDAGHLEYIRGGWGKCSIYRPLKTWRGDRPDLGYAYTSDPKKARGQKATSDPKKARDQQATFDPKKARGLIPRNLGTTSLRDLPDKGGAASSGTPPISTGALTSDVVRDNSTNGAKEEERARLEGARSPSATVRAEECSHSAPEKERPHPQTPSPDGAGFEDFMAAYPKCWLGADDPNSGEFIDEWHDAEEEWCKCEMSEYEMAEVVRGAERFAQHVNEQIMRGADPDQFCTPSQFLEDDLWEHPGRWAPATERHPMTGGETADHDDIPF